MADISMDGHDLRGSRQTTATIAAAAFATVAAWLAEARDRRERRLTLAALLAYGDGRLDDLGLNRQDIVEAMQGR